MKSCIAVPSRDKAIRGKSSSRCAAPSKGKDFHGKSPSRCAASSEGNDVYEEEFPHNIYATAQSSLKPLPDIYFQGLAYEYDELVWQAGTDGAGNPMISC